MSVRISLTFENDMIAESRFSDQNFCHAVLSERADALLGKLNSLKHRPSKKAIHRSRIETRRMRAALEAFRNLFPKTNWKSLNIAIKKITRTLGEPREIGVILKILTDLSYNADITDQECLGYLIKKYRRKLRKQKKRLRNNLKLLDFDQLGSQLDILFSVMNSQAKWDELGSANQPGRRRGNSNHYPLQLTLFTLHTDAHIRAQRILNQLAQPILAFNPKHDFPGATDEELHALRISAKKLRYAMEIFNDALPGRLKNEIVITRALQDAGGLFHDWCTLCEYLKKNTHRLNKGKNAHLAIQTGRLLAYAEGRKAELRNSILPAQITLQNILYELLPHIDKPFSQSSKPKLQRATRSKKETFTIKPQRMVVASPHRRVSRVRLRLSEPQAQ